MKKIIFILALFFSFSAIAQPRLSFLFTRSYSELHIAPRITNSGIYGLKYFFWKDGEFFFVTEKDVIVTDAEGNLVESQRKKREVLSLKPSLRKSFEESGVVRNFSLSGGEFLKYHEGTYESDSGIRITVNRKSASLLEIEGLPSENEKVKFDFPHNLAYCGILGTDKAGNTFLLIEKYLSEVPLKVEREIWTLAPDASVLNKIHVPTIKYLSLENEFYVSPDGELFHLISLPEGIKILKWSGLNQKVKGILNYPAEYDYFLHFNDYVTTKEIRTKINNPDVIAVSTERAKVLRTAASYIEHKYYCTPQNLAPNGTIAPDGDAVKTPSWLRVGWNARIPYKWGGFNTVWGFDQDLSHGEYAGDINTNGVSGYAVGVDCSGYVSRCWGLTYHASTAYMPNITNKYNSWDDLKPGDAVHKVGHVRLFVKMNSDGSLKIAEAAGRNWDVSYWSYKPSDLYSYTPRYYVGMTNKYAEKTIRLLSVLNVGSGKAELVWSCDTNGVEGYRIYESADGKNWELKYDENEIKSDSVVIPFEGAGFFRVSAVCRYANGLVENNWSNPMGLGTGEDGKCLIVDGYDRDYGTASWQGDGNPFAVIYGRALENLSRTFESARHSEVISGKVKLSDYKTVFWYVGDESTVDETFSATEQSLIKNYLETGGNLFVSGSEIGWDLYYKGNSADKSFYKNYFKAVYKSDDARTDVALGVPGTNFEGLYFYFGQTYTEDYPDVIEPYGGSALCLKYSNGGGAGIFYSGSFGNSSQSSNLIYFAFPPETTADDSVFFEIIKDAVAFFDRNTSVNERIPFVRDFKIYSAYPNPFGAGSASGNSVITFSFVLAKSFDAKISVYNVLGEKVAEVLRGTLKAGKYSFDFSPTHLASGVYFVGFDFGGRKTFEKIVFLK
jgi:hypothetical protein